MDEHLTNEREEDCTKEKELIKNGRSLIQDVERIVADLDILTRLLIQVEEIFKQKNILKKQDFGIFQKLADDINQYWDNEATDYNIKTSLQGKKFVIDVKKKKNILISKQDNLPASEIFAMGMKKYFDILAANWGKEEKKTKTEL